MIVIESDNTVFFDCDDTLVMWNIPIGKEEETITFNNYGFVERLLPHEKHISQLKRHAARGHRIVVWSASGWEWAQSVVKTLKIEAYVDLVMSKPKWFYDDLTSKEFMPESNRIYFDCSTKLNTTQFGDIE